MPDMADKRIMTPEDKGGKQDLFLDSSLVASFVNDYHSLHRNPIFKPNLMSLEIKFKAGAELADAINK